MRFRERNQMYSRHIGDWYQWETEGSPYDHPEYRVVLGNHSICWDENHGRNWKQKKRLIDSKTSGSDAGGPLNILSQTVSRMAESSTIFRVNGIGHDRGKYYSGMLTAKEEPDPPIQDAKSIADAAGASLWNRARPAKPVIDLSVALFELKDVPGLLKQRFQRRLGSIGDAYLYEKFGVEPLLKDLRDFILSHFQFKKALDQILRDEGKAVRRKARLPAKFVDYGDYHGDQYDAFEQHLVTQAYAEVPHLRVNWSEGTDVWFSGTFRYWLPPGPRDWQWTARIIAEIYGLNPKLSQVYKVVPWSWLVDWFSNVGDVLQNFSGGVEDRMSADYAYVMCKKWYMRKSWATGQFYGGNSEDSKIGVSSETQKYTENKVRVAASPFGFALKDNELSLTQNAILGALGLSRLR